MWIVQNLRRQFLQNFPALGGAALHIKRERVSDGAVRILGRALVGLLRERLRLFRILLDVQSEAREIWSDHDLVRRRVVQTLKHVVEFFGVVAPTIELVKCIQRFTATRRIFGKARPKFFAFNWQVPFAGETREPNFVFRLSGSTVQGCAPQRIELGVGARLARLARSESLIGESKVIVVAPRFASSPPSQTRPTLLFGERSRDRDCGRWLGRNGRRQFFHSFYHVSRKPVPVHPLPP